MVTYSLLAEFQHDVDVERVVEKAMEAHNVAMVQRFVNRDFLCHLLLLVVLHHQLFRHDLAGVHFARHDIHDFVAFCESTL